MPIILSSATKKDHRIYIQYLFVWIAFTLMVIFSYLFMKGSERDHLLRGAADALANAETEITASLLEPETFLNGFAESVFYMVQNGAKAKDVTNYMQHIYTYTMNDQKNLVGFNDCYALLEVYNDLYVSGQGWVPPDDYNPKERPWYKASREVTDRIVITKPYVNYRSGEVVITYVRHLSYAHHTRPNDVCLGVICLDIKLDRVQDFAVDIRLTRGGYGLLLDSELELIAYPNKARLGKDLTDINPNFSVIMDELREGKPIIERKIKNNFGGDDIVFFRKTKNDWYIGIVAPKKEYYERTTNMIGVLILLGVVMATILTAVLMREAKARQKSDLENKQKSNFLATMSHEIRTPMNAILGIAEIQLQNDNISQDSRESFVKIYNSGDLLLGIINDILDLSKIEAGKMELVKHKYEVASLINDVVQLNVMRFESKAIEFKLHVDESVPSVLIGDELRIKQVLNNLISNAFKYTEEGEVKMSVTPDYVARGGAIHVWLVFTISDTGQGMTPAQVNKLFDEYSRFNVEANRATVGTGLGMAITRNLVEMMYGTINVDSTPNKGTTVTVRIPQTNTGVGLSNIIGKELAKNLENFHLDSTSQLKKAKIMQEPMPYGSVLIVDDVETNLFVAKGLMIPYGLNITTAESGFEAIDYIKDGKKFDVIFMDHMMPKMDGIEATKIIRGMGYQGSIVALTANALAGQADMFMSNGFDGFISKPIDVRELNSSLLKLIRDKQSPQVIEEARLQKVSMRVANASTTHKVSMASQLSEIFKRDTEKAITTLTAISTNEYRRSNDVQTYIINVHSMKSVLANVGEQELSAQAQKLEQAGRENNISLMIAETPGFLASLRQVIEKVEAENETSESVPETEAEEDKDFLREKLLALQAACEALDKKTAKSTIAELRQKSLSYNTRELLSKISEHLLHSDFTEAVAAAKEYVGTLSD